jgi:2-dehydro-3-deoxygalactonokinase
VEEDPLARIVPGLKGPGVTGASDVMRGEETQIFGWLALDPGAAAGPPPGLPPRHLMPSGPWWRTAGSSRFVTAMTGELFDILRKHSVLKTQTRRTIPRPSSKGVQAAGDGGGLSTRCSPHAGRVVADGKPASSTSEYLSGLLIGSEAASVPNCWAASARRPCSWSATWACAAGTKRRSPRAGSPPPSATAGMAAIAGLKALQHGAER